MKEINENSRFYTRSIKKVLKKHDFRNLRNIIFALLISFIFYIASTILIYVISKNSVTIYNFDSLDEIVLSIFGSSFATLAIIVAINKRSFLGIKLNLMFFSANIFIIFSLFFFVLMSIFALFLFFYYWLFNGDVINILTTSLFSILYSLLVFVFSIYYALANEEKIAIKYFLSVFYKTNGTQNIKSDKMLNKLYKNQSIDAYLKTFSHSSFENSYFSFISSFLDFCDGNKITKPDIKFFYDISLKFCKKYKNDYMLFGVCAYVVFITLKLIRESENNDFKNYILNCYYNFENKIGRASCRERV